MSIDYTKKYSQGNVRFSTKIIKMFGNANNFFNMFYISPTFSLEIFSDNSDII